MQSVVTQKLIDLAAIYAHNGAEMQDSALLCLEDARILEASRRYDAAKYRAMRSLSYSVGVLSPVYNQAKTILTNSQQWEPL